MEVGLELDYGVVDGAGGHMEYLRNGVNLELKVRDMLSEKVVEKNVPLQYLYLGFHTVHIFRIV